MSERIEAGQRDDLLRRVPFDTRLVRPGQQVDRGRVAPDDVAVVLAGAFIGVQVTSGGGGNARGIEQGLDFHGSQANSLTDRLQVKGLLVIEAVGGRVAGRAL